MYITGQQDGTFVFVCSSKEEWGSAFDFYIEYIYRWRILIHILATASFTSWVINNCKFFHFIKIFHFSHLNPDSTFVVLLLFRVSVIRFHHLNKQILDLKIQEQNH